MLKFIKHTMETIVGIEVFPIISFLIFFSFFIGLLIYVKRLSKSHISDMGALPLEKDEYSPTYKLNSNE
ncbi:MAG: CcoQ/FixQ family Cbb3-type cytochrome c oxidase assembly chaperone [Bacteroidota bacterium]